MEPIARNLIDKLISLNLISTRNVVNGSVIFGMGRQRNWAFYYKPLHGPGIFIKQANESEPAARASLRHEADIYERVASNARCAKLAALIPRFHAFDADTATLFTEMLPNSEDLGTRSRRSAPVSSQFMGKLGAALAQIHLVPTEVFAREACPLTSEIHWIFRLEENPSPIALLRERSAAGAECIDAISQNEIIMALLARRRAQWLDNCVTHGDFKWENVLVIDDPEQPLRIIDWEHASIGDPAWDLGCGLAAFPRYEAMMQAADAAVDHVELYAAMTSFWLGYLQAGTVKPTIKAELLSRVIEMAAARLLVAAYECCYDVHEMPALGRALLARAKDLAGQEGKVLESALLAATPSAS